MRRNKWAPMAQILQVDSRLGGTEGTAVAALQGLDHSGGLYASYQLEHSIAQTWVLKLPLERDRQAAMCLWSLYLRVHLGRWM